MFQHGRHLYLPLTQGIARTGLGTADLRVWWTEEGRPDPERPTHGDGAWWQYCYKSITAPGAIVGDRYYYGAEWRLRSLALPQD